MQHGVLPENCLTDISNVHRDRGLGLHDLLLWLCYFRKLLNLLSLHWAVSHMNIMMPDWGRIKSDKAHSFKVLKPFVLGFARVKNIVLSVRELEFCNLHLSEFFYGVTICFFGGSWTKTQSGIQLTVFFLFFLNSWARASSFALNFPVLIHQSVPRYSESDSRDWMELHFVNGTGAAGAGPGWHQGYCPRTPATSPVPSHLEKPEPHMLGPQSKCGSLVSLRLSSRHRS